MNDLIKKKLVWYYRMFTHKPDAEGVEDGKVCSSCGYSNPVKPPCGRKHGGGTTCLPDLPGSGFHSGSAALTWDRTMLIGGRRDRRVAVCNEHGLLLGRGECQIISRDGGREVVAHGVAHGGRRWGFGDGGGVTLIADGLFVVRKSRGVRSLSLRG